MRAHPEAGPLARGRSPSSEPALLCGAPVPVRPRLPLARGPVAAPGLVSIDLDDFPFGHRLGGPGIGPAQGVRAVQGSRL